MPTGQSPTTSSSLHLNGTNTMFHNISVQARLQLYDEQFIRVKIKEWIIDRMQCLVGVFQGCPLSCTLFLAVFNLCLDRLDGLKDVGFHLNSNLAPTAMAYADDLTLTAKDPVGCQTLINSVEEFLAWTRTMKAKPAKCKAHAMKKFVPDKKETKRCNKKVIKPNMLHMIQN